MVIRAEHANTGNQTLSVCVELLMVVLQCKSVLFYHKVKLIEIILNLKVNWEILHRQTLGINERKCCL